MSNVVYLDDYRPKKKRNHKRTLAILFEYLNYLKINILCAGLVFLGDFSVSVEILLLVVMLIDLGYLFTSD